MNCAAFSEQMTCGIQDSLYLTCQIRTLAYQLNHWRSFSLSAELSREQ